MRGKKGLLFFSTNGDFYTQQTLRGNISLSHKILKTDWMFDMSNLQYCIPGLVLTDYTFTVPLDYANPDKGTIEVFAREVRSPEEAAEKRPWLVFFQGGPGSESPRPTGKSGWIARAIKEYRVLLLDQRGTGRSTPINFQSLSQFKTAQEQADYLKCFRADSIVQDAEYIRKNLVGEDEKWSALGQSYGGFCITTYLSFAPEGLKEVIFTGGLPPIMQSVDDVYRATYKRVIDKNELYYARYSGDADLIHEIVDHLQNHEVKLPGGGILTPRRFQQLGLGFGSINGYETVHYLVENAFVHTGSARELSYNFLRQIETIQHFETNPIFAVLHEAIYCEENASNWSAERIRAEYPQFNISPDKPIYFTGEMIYPWMFDDYAYLRPMKEAAEILARYQDWQPLYDLDALANNTVPAVAIIYYDDMYVERAFSDETARHIRGLRYWATSEFEHSGLRENPDRVLGRLLDMLHGEA